ncbi:MAG: choice-of-anchor V domain-containing protein [Polyangiaceae bacterium]
MSLRGQRPWIAAAVMAAVHGAAGMALAHSGGQPSGGCEGCHGSADYAISGVASPASFQPGDEVTVTVTFGVSGASKGGMFVDSDVGEMSTIGGQGLSEVEQGLTHSAPKSMSGGSVSFAFDWQAPSSPGAVRFRVWTVAANGNGSSSGDKAGFTNVDFVYGCAAATYFRDADGDGYGRLTDTRIHCTGAPPTGYAVEGGDCDDNVESIHPGATEVCNSIDDDCDEVVDEDAVPLDLYPDEDGDGYYGLAEHDMGVQEVGCAPAKGLAGFPGDCQPTVAAVNPGAEEVCNLIDDDCDSNVDEKVRPRCGEGWCTRESDSCDPQYCVPGDPQPEECNLLDDDCDGQVDEGALCGLGESCVAAECVPTEIGPGVGSSGAGAGAPAESGGGDGGCAVSEGRSSVFAAGLGALALAWLVRRRQRTRTR